MRAQARVTVLMEVASKSAVTPAGITSFLVQVAQGEQEEAHPEASVDAETHVQALKADLELYRPLY